MPSAWVAHVKKYYSERKKKEPGYKYKNAMKDARASYTKAGAKEDKVKAKPKRRRKKKAAEEEKEVPKPKRRRKTRVPKDFTKSE